MKIKIINQSYFESCKFVGCLCNVYLLNVSKKLKKLRQTEESEVILYQNYKVRN